MKKLIAVAAALVVTSAAAFALDITVGARGNFNMGIGTSVKNDDDGDFDGNMGAGFGIYANFGLLELGGGSLGVQPEVGMNFNNGANYSESGYSTSLEDITVDIPVLVTFTYPVMDALTIGGGIGPYLSIPFGLDVVNKTPLGTSKMSESLDIKGSLNFGLAFDVNAAYKLGPGSIVFDARYMMDLTPTKIQYKPKDYDIDWSDSQEILTRRLLTLGVGYQIKF